MPPALGWRVSLTADLPAEVGRRVSAPTAEEKRSGPAECRVGAAASAPSEGAWDTASAAGDCDPRSPGVAQPGHYGLSGAGSGLSQSYGGTKIRAFDEYEPRRARRYPMGELGIRSRTETAAGDSDGRR